MRVIMGVLFAFAAMSGLSAQDPCVLGTTDHFVFPSDRPVTLTAIRVQGKACVNIAWDATSQKFVVPMRIFAQYLPGPGLPVVSVGFRETSVGDESGGQRPELFTLESGGPDGLYRFVLTNGTNFLHEHYIIRGSLLRGLSIGVGGGGLTIPNIYGELPEELRGLPAFRSSGVVSGDTFYLPGALPGGPASAVLYQMHGPRVGVQGRERGWVESLGAKLDSVGSGYVPDQSIRSWYPGVLKVGIGGVQHSLEVDRPVFGIILVGNRSISEMIYDPSDPIRYGFTGFGAAFSAK